MKKNFKKHSGITLIALIITIIVMLILVAVTITTAINGGLFEKAGKPSSTVKISLSIAGTKVTTIPIPDGFEHVEGTTIDTGYVIRNSSDGNEFVWVPVEKDQKMTLKITSEKDITEVKLYDPYGDEILSVADGEIETTYSNTNINPTINGMYTVKVTTEDGTETKTLTVRSLYAVDCYNDFYASEEYAISQGYSSKQKMYQAWADEDYDGSIEDMLQDWKYLSIEEYESDYSWMKDYEDLADYTESVNSNGGFYIGRYEAGATTARTIESTTATVDEIKAANGTPVSQEGYVPYNYVTFDQALGLVESMYSSSDFEISLLTGAAWDRTLGWIYETGSKSIKEIAVDSGNWGNYDDVKFKISKGKYSENWGNSYTAVSGTYKKKKGNTVLLTTGATTRNAVNNIFDLAGNVEEWTNEAYFSAYRVYRGGYYVYRGSDNPASYRSVIWSGRFDGLVGFRAALYIK